MSANQEEVEVVVEEKVVKKQPQWTGARCLSMAELQMGYEDLTRKKFKKMYKPNLTWENTRCDKKYINQLLAEDAVKRGIPGLIKDQNEHNDPTDTKTYHHMYDKHEWRYLREPDCETSFMKSRAHLRKESDAYSEKSFRSEKIIDGISGTNQYEKKALMPDEYKWLNREGNMSNYQNQILKTLRHKQKIEEEMSMRKDCLEIRFLEYMKQSGPSKNKFGKYRYMSEKYLRPQENIY